MIRTLSTVRPAARSSATGVGQLDGVSPVSRPRRPLTPAAMSLRNLRYYRELLDIGYHCALHPDPFPRSLRGERIALGIDLAELDTIPLWSNKRPDGAVAIPMAGFILERFGRCVDEFCAALDLDDREELQGLRDARQALRDELAAILPRKAKDANLALLADIYIAEDRLRRLCGRNGLLEQILAGCEALLGAASEHA